ncbi:MAG: hypothetical protein EA350_02465 [Gemmatimonadales bacterium]|nr:MAG: hypothetical protein EA350_02465 [Gemmatimonadales bacterium]
MAGPLVTPPVRPLVGVIPCADRSGAIGGAPPPLLQTGEGSFLERAIALLRVAGVDQVLVGVRDRRDPVAAEALRAGASVVEVAEGDRDPAASLRAAGAAVRGGGPGVQGESGSPPGPGPAVDPAPVSTYLCLPPTFPLIRKDTMEELARAWREAASPARILAPVLPADSPRAGIPWWELAPLFLRGPDPAARLPQDPGHPPDALPVRVEVVDPGVAERIDTLPLYRRHFPQAFRKRFQKW